jgi:alcohol/geraniol dehydrogenase (NADP+)
VSLRPATLGNDWGWSQFPAVLGHEAVVTVVQVGRAAKGVKVGQKVGVGWTAESCMYCRQCMSGEHHMCP